MSFFKGCLRGALLSALLVLCGCQKSPDVSITFGGDMFLARDGNALFTQVDPWSQVSKAIQRQQSGAQQTFFFANLESPVYEATQTGQTSKPSGYDLCADSSQLKLLKQGGVSLVNLANNHEMDCGSGSTDATRQTVLQNGINVVGPDLIPTFLDTTAGKIGILAAEDVTQPLNIDGLISAIQTVRKQCDVLIVSLHWGNEYQTGESQRQQQLAQKLADAGVDVLWGTHPHVLQSIKWVSSSDGKHQMLAMYSLGNLLTDQWMTSDTQQSVLVTLQFQAKNMVKISILPIQMDRSSLQLTLPNTDVVKMIEDRLGVNEISTAIISLSAP